MKLKNYLVEGVLITLVLIFAGVIVLRQPLRENVTPPPGKTPYKPGSYKVAADKFAACSTCADPKADDDAKKTACTTCDATAETATKKAISCLRCSHPIDPKTATADTPDIKPFCTECGVDPPPFKDKIFGIEFKDEKQANMAYIGGGIALVLLIGGILMFALRPTPAPVIVSGMGRRRR